MFAPSEHRPWQAPPAADSGSFAPIHVAACSRRANDRWRGCRANALRSRNVRSRRTVDAGRTRPSPIRAATPVVRHPMRRRPPGRVSNTRTAGTLPGVGHPMRHRRLGRMDRWSRSRARRQQPRPMRHPMPHSRHRRRPDGDRHRRYVRLMHTTRFAWDQPGINPGPEPGSARGREPGHPGEPPDGRSPTASRAAGTR